MRKLSIALALVGAISVLGPAGTALAVSNKSSTGHYYRPGEFCPHRDLGQTIADPYGTMKCIVESGYPHWHRV